MRATLDFDDEQAFRAQLDPARRESVALWDSLFEMPWRVFRSRIRVIARSNLERVEGAVCASWEEIPEGSLVLPCDDDDWFRPDVAKVIEQALEPGMTGIRWHSSFLEVPTDWRHQLGIWRRHVRGPRPQFLCTTNNYALFASEDSKQQLVNHMKASRWVGTQPAGSVPFLHDRLSLMNRTLASDTSLRPQQRSIERRPLLRKLRGYQRLYDHALPPRLAWAQPYADEMGALMRELELR